MKKVMDRRLSLLDPVEFTLTHLMGRLDVTPLNETIAYHHTCSSVKMGLEAKALSLARTCARTVVVPDLVGCCGFAGDRGFNHPELNASALQHLRPGWPDALAATPPAAPARSGCRPTAGSITNPSFIWLTGVRGKKGMEVLSFKFYVLRKRNRIG